MIFYLLKKNKNFKKHKNLQILRQKTTIRKIFFNEGQFLEVVEKII